MTNVPIVTGATAYDDPITGQTIILVFNESLYYGTKLDHSLINPNQIRSYGIDMWDNPYDQDHPMAMHVSDMIIIPLQTYGTKIYFNSRSPTDDELSTLDHYPVTSARPWNPESVSLLQTISETIPIPFRSISQVSHVPQWAYIRTDSNDALLHDINPTLVQLRERMLSSMNTAMQPNDVPLQRTFVSTQRHSKATAETLCKRFLISPNKARATLQATTQKGLRSAILPIGRRYRADRMFDVRRLHGKFYTDTLWGTTNSLRSHAASQVYYHKCSFVAIYHLL